MLDMKMIRNNILPMLFKHIWKLFLKKSLKKTSYNQSKENPPTICYCLFPIEQKKYSFTFLSFKVPELCYRQESAGLKFKRKF